MNHLELDYLIKRTEDALRAWRDTSPSDLLTVSEIKEATDFFEKKLKKLKTIANS